MFRCTNCGTKYEEEMASDSDVAICKWCSNDEWPIEDILDAIDAGVQTEELGLQELKEIRKYVDNMIKSKEVI